GGGGGGGGGGGAGGGGGGGGGCELLEAASGAPGQFILLGTLVVSGDAVATSRNILENTTQFQLGIAANLVSVAFHVVWTYLMYELLMQADRGLSLFAALAGVTAAA